MMRRTQISLTEDERRSLQAESARTGRSVSSLIRSAIDTLYGTERPAEADLRVMKRAFGAWKDRDMTGAAWAERMRSGRRPGRSA